MSEVADDLAEIASLVRELRKRKGITLQALADAFAVRWASSPRSSAACRGRRWTT